MWNLPRNFTSSYVLDVRNGQSITVADMLDAISRAIKFIKANFNVNQEKYSMALKALEITRVFTERPGCADCPDSLPRFILESR